MTERDAACSQGNSEHSKSFTSKLRNRWSRDLMKSLERIDEVRWVLANCSIPHHEMLERLINHVKSAEDLIIRRGSSGSRSVVNVYELDSEHIGEGYLPSNISSEVGYKSATNGILLDKKGQAVTAEMFQLERLPMNSFGSTVGEVDKAA